MVVVCSVVVGSTAVVCTVVVGSMVVVSAFVDIASVEGASALVVPANFKQ